MSTLATKYKYYARDEVIYKYDLNPYSATDDNFKFLPLFQKNNKAWYFMRIVCWQTILMKYHTLFKSLSKTWKDFAAAVVIGALRENLKKK